MLQSQTGLTRPRKTTAPHSLDDLFDCICRHNPTRVSADSYGASRSRCASGSDSSFFSV
jgi:hypothetical protein